jgi:hypothetical protein
MKNPYTSRAALQDASLFFGRDFELSEIGAFVNGNQSVSIVGPRKIGKSSLMLRLMRPETMRAFGIGAETLFAYIDCQAFSSCPQNEIFAIFCTEIAAALHRQDLETEPVLKAALSNPTWSAFELALRKLNQRGLRLVLMLDEFEQLTLNPHVDVSFYNALRSAAGRLRLAFLTGSAKPLIELTYFDRSKKILSSPFFNIFAQVYLGLLTRSEAGDLIRKPAQSAGKDVSLQLKDFIYRLVGGHPLALQIACFYAWVNPQDQRRIEQQTLQELDAHFQYYWHNLSPAERDVLRHPVESGFQEADDAAVKVVLRDLMRKCLLVQVEGAYTYPSRAWAEFVASHTENPVVIPKIEPPVQGESADSRGGQIREHPRGQTPSISKTTGRTIREVLRESLPEAIGGIVVVLVVALFTQGIHLVDALKSLYDRAGPVGLILASLAILVLAIAAIRIALRRKPGRLAVKKSTKEG